MTRISLLQDQKANFESLKQAVQDNLEDIRTRELEALRQALAGFYMVLPKEVDVEITTGGLYFKMDHPEYSYKKDLFTVYLKENWNLGEDDPRVYKGVDLSYYTTSTKGVDHWELRRLQMLGQIAQVVYDFHDGIVEAANKAAAPFQSEYKEASKNLHEVGKLISEIEGKIVAVEKSEIIGDLMDGGVEFSKDVCIRLKYNYSPWIKTIKLVDVSKSGKKATAVFTFTHYSHESKEENVDVQSIIDQVYSVRKDIVQHTSAE